MAATQPIPHTHAPNHRHDHCVHDALARAETLCAARGTRLTAQRRRVLELVWSGHEPVGAYELLERLRLDGMRAAPPTVYRALDFLLDHGLVHRLESLNAFIGCPTPTGEHASVFLICTKCREVVEAHDSGADGALDKLAKAQGFVPSRRVVEITGLCARCSGG
jgi:Fur family zinc uptake transcriptional regulator